MIKYSNPALLAFPRLFAYRNEIDIFTEDNLEDKEFYKTLLGRLLDGSRKKVIDITPLGSKRDVIKAHRARSSSSARKAIYIVDGDITIILEENISDSSNFIFLDRYCIENYLFCENAAIELAHLIAYRKTKEQIANELSFSTHYNYVLKPIIDIYFAFALCRKYEVGEEFTTLPCFFGHKNSIRIPDIVKRKDEILTVIKKELSDKGFSGDEIVESDMAVLRKKWPYTLDTFVKIVSGKDYLLHLLRSHICSATDGKKVYLDKDAFKLFLAKNCNLSTLSFLKNAIETN